MNLSVSKDDLLSIAEMAENAGPEAKAIRDKLLNLVHPPKLVNLTAHDITICDPYGQPIKTIPPRDPDNPARAYLKTVDSCIVDGAEIVEQECTDITPLPEPEYNTYYIVSSMYALYAPADRTDLLTVFSQVRDDNGRVIGCRRLAKVK